MALAKTEVVTPTPEELLVVDELEKLIDKDLEKEVLTNGRYVLNVYPAEQKVGVGKVTLRVKIELKKRYRAAGWSIDYPPVPSSAIIVLS